MKSGSVTLFDGYIVTSTFRPPPLPPPPWAALEQHSELFLFLQCFLFFLPSVLNSLCCLLCVAFPFCRVIFRMLLFNSKANRKTKLKQNGGTACSGLRPKMQNGQLNNCWIGEITNTVNNWKCPYVLCLSLEFFIKQRNQIACVYVCVYVEHIDWHLNVTCIAMAAIRA